LYFFSTHPPTSEIYSLSLHDALPILTSLLVEFSSISEILAMLLEFNNTNRKKRKLKITSLTGKWRFVMMVPLGTLFYRGVPHLKDRKSTRLNSSHDQISYAVFCLKKK